MDYEKKYNEALERAKHIYEELNDVGKKDIGTIFPELAESEDERIRKEIVHYILYKADGVSEEQEHEWIAYLEKRKEQKPVEWSAYDKATIEYIIEDIKGLRDEETDEEAIETYDRELNLLQCINDSVNLCNYTKPAEWSEEDETAFGDLMWCMEQARKSAKDENDMGNIWFAENWVKNRLKSLRPSWKPTEEQMGWLESAVRLSTDKPRIHGIIISLYEQLKRL